MPHTLHFGVPYITDNEGRARLCVDTVWEIDGKKYDHVFFYEVEKEWGKYFVTEKSDAFVLAFLEIAMEHGLDLEFEAPISEELKYQLERYLIPVYAQHFEMLHEIRLSGPVTTDVIPSENVTGTGFSGGVDSFYTVLSHLHTEMPGKNVTHVVLAVNGAAITGMTEEIDEAWYREEMDRFAPATEKLGVKLIGIRSNTTILNSYKQFLPGGDAIVTSAFIHSLAKLFGTYYWASAYEAAVLKFDPIDGGYMEPFVIPLVSVRGLCFYHSGSETNRVGKVKYIADNPIAQKTLTVCAQVRNCGRCPKCLRTMAELASIGKLENFKDVFPVEEYKKHFTSRLANELAVDHPPFTTDILRSMRENGIGISPVVFIKKYMWYKPLFYFRRRFRNNKLAMKLYYQKGWSKKIDGVEYDEMQLQARIERRGEYRKE